MCLKLFLYSVVFPCDVLWVLHVLTQFAFDMFECDVHCLFLVASFQPSELLLVFLIRAYRAWAFASQAIRANVGQLVVCFFVMLRV